MYTIAHPWFSRHFCTEEKLYEECKDMKGLYGCHILKDGLKAGYTLGDLANLHK